MIVHSLNWLSESAKEAELVVTDEKHSLVVFSQPCSVAKGDKITERLHVFMPSNLMLSDATVEKIEKGISPLASFIIAKMVNTPQGLCAVGGIEFEIEEHIPGGIQDGDIIQFNCARVDLW